ncbi:MAG: VPLPA-CTERM sorting domain-containing protein [Pseudomonadota bacterium]
MKLKSLLLAAAITAASFSGVANAAIDGVTPVGSVLNSDLVLVISDAVLDLSYVQVLDGFNYNTIVGAATAGTFSGSFNLDAAALNVFAASNRANMVWSMATASVNDDLGEVTGNIMTMSAPSLQDSGLLAIVGAKFGNLAISANTTTAIGTGALVATGGTGSNLSFNAKTWNDHVSSTFGVDTSANVSVAQTLWYSSTDVNYEAVTPSMASANAWVLDLTTNTLSSTPAVVAPVPLPAAAWLMFSALMGLGGIARRRSAKV